MAADRLRGTPQTAPTSEVDNWSTQALSRPCPRCGATAGERCYDERRPPYNDWAGNEPRIKRPHRERLA